MDLLPENRPAVEAHLRRLGWLASDEPLLGLAPLGQSSLNRTLRAETPARTFILKQPAPYVESPPDIAAPANRLQVEGAFYGAVAGCDALAIRTPEVLGEDPEHHLLSLTDLGPGPNFLDVYGAPEMLRGEQRRADGHLTALTYWLWKLHALPAAALAEVPAFQNRDMRALKHAQVFEIPLTSESPARLEAALRPVRAEFAADAALTRRARTLGATYLGQAEHDSAAVLLHGNYYPGSWLRHGRMGVMIIDPQFAFIGPPEFDVGVFLAHLTLAGLDQTELAMLMRSYVTPPGFSYPLALAFAGMEIIHSLLGAAERPLTASNEVKLEWLQTARAMVLG